MLWGKGVIEGYARIMDNQMEDQMANEMATTVCSLYPNISKHGSPICGNSKNYAPESCSPCLRNLFTYPYTLNPKRYL